MRSPIYGALLALLLATAGTAQPPGDVVIVPPSPPVPPIKWVPVTGTAPVNSDVTLAAGVRSEWALIDAGPTLRVSDDGKTAVLRSDAPGAFRLLVISEGKAQFRIVTVSGPPKPPDPPAPNPLRDRIKAAFDADQSPRKAEHAKDLAALYKQAATLAESADVPTGGELVRRVREASALMLKPDELVGVRKQVAIELSAVLGEDGPLTETSRRDVARLFRDLAAILEAL